MSENYYRVLGIGEKADDKEIKTAYRRLARQYHPDVNPDDQGAEEKFKAVGVAYDTLGDPEKRAAYDKEHKAQKGAGRSAASGRGGNAGGQASGPRATNSAANSFGSAASSGGFDSVFEGLFGGTAAARAAAGPAHPGGTAAAPGSDDTAAQRITISLEEAFHGATRTQTSLLDKACSECHGTGTSQAGRSSLEVGTMCLACRGSGRKKQNETVQITIPPGIYEGAKLRVKGKGSTDAQKNQPDLIFSVYLSKHDRYEQVSRESNDLAVSAFVPYTTLVLGGEVEIETLSGKKVLTIPAGTQSGQQLRLPGLGLPTLRDRAGGDLLVRVNVAVPRQVGVEEQRLLLDLARLRGDPVRLR